MKWLDLLAIWSTSLHGRRNREIDINLFLQVGTYDAQTETFAIAHDKVRQFAMLLQHYGVSDALHKTLLLMAKQHEQERSLLILHVREDCHNSAWRTISQTLFRNRWIINWRTIIDCGDGMFGMQYVGLHSNKSFLMGGNYIRRVRAAISVASNNNVEGVALVAQNEREIIAKQLSVIVFQLLWTFAVLSQTGLHIKLSNSAAEDFDIFDSLLVQEQRSEHFGAHIASENGFFFRSDSIDDVTTDGVYMVPIGSAFVTIQYEPSEQLSFVHRRYWSRNRLVNVSQASSGATLCGKSESNLADADDVRSGSYLSHMAHLLRMYLFATHVPPKDGDCFRPIFDALFEIESAGNCEQKKTTTGNHNGNSSYDAFLGSSDDAFLGSSVDAFFDSALAQSYWREFRQSEREQIVETLAREGALPVLYFPRPDAQSIVQRCAYRSNWCGFANLDNNCFLNSTLFALMCPMGNKNSFNAAVAHHADAAPLSADDFEFIRSIEGYLIDGDDMERARRLIAKLFCSALRAAYALSNYGAWQPSQVAEADEKIQKHCANLLPLLDLWSLAQRDVCFAKSAGEFQDVGECLQLLCELLKFEECRVSTVAVTEEFRNVPFVQAEQANLNTDDLERYSLEQSSNPLCLRVQSAKEWPLLRLFVDWSTMPTLDDIIDLQLLCDRAAYECSLVPAPRTTSQKRREAETGVPSLVATRYIVKRHVRSRQSRMFVVHIPRQKDLHTMHMNRIRFGDGGNRLRIDEQNMIIESLILWRGGHYTSLVHCPVEQKWYHVNDLQLAGQRCEEFGNTFAAAVERLDRERLCITSVCCLRADDVVDANSDEPRRAEEREFDAQLHNELQKLALANDSTKHKALLMRKDRDRFRSALECAQQFDRTVVRLPERFLFGHDNPNTDFHFIDAWYADESPLPRQSTQLALVLAAGAPLDIDDSQAVSTLFDCNALDSVRERALVTSRALARLTDRTQSLNDEAINMSLDALQAQHLGLSARQYVAAGGTDSLKFDWYSADETVAQFDASCWFFSTFFYTLMTQGFERVVGQVTRRSDRRAFQLFRADNVLVPLHEPDRNHWTLLRIDVRSHTLLYYDSLAGDGTHHCVAMMQFLHSLGDDAAWTVQNVYEKPLQLLESDDLVSCGVFLLYFCEQIYENNATALEELETVTQAQIAEWRDRFASRLRQYGNLDSA